MDVPHVFQTPFQVPVRQQQHAHHARTTRLPVHQHTHTITYPPITYLPTHHLLTHPPIHPCIHPCTPAPTHPTRAGRPVGPVVWGARLIPPPARPAPRHRRAPRLAEARDRGGPGTGRAGPVGEALRASVQGDAVAAAAAGRTAAAAGRTHKHKQRTATTTGIPTGPTGRTAPPSASAPGTAPATIPANASTCRCSTRCSTCCSAHCADRTAL
jgi:hypothetical protein